MKGIVIGAAAFVVFVGGLYFILHNAHIDIFPCEKAYHNYQTGKPDLPASGTCSLMAVDRYESGGEDIAKLTAIGHMVKWFVIIGLPAVLGLVLTFVFRKKKGAPEIS